MIVAEFTPEELGRLRQAVREMRRKAEKSMNRASFDPVLGIGALRRKDDFDALHLKLAALAKEV